MCCLPRLLVKGIRIFQSLFADGVIIKHKNMCIHVKYLQVCILYNKMYKLVSATGGLIPDFIATRAATVR